MTDITALTAENWWEQIPGRKEGGAKLLKRCIELLAWRVDFAMNVLLAYKDFLEAKVSIGDFDGTMLEPSMPVYQMWSQHILDTACYSKDCEILFGRVVHYDASLFKDHQNRTARINRTIQLVYERNKGSFIDPIVWNYGHPPPYSGIVHAAPMPPVSYGVANPGGENDTHEQHKRPRIEGGAQGSSPGFASYEMAPPVLNQRHHQPAGRVPKEPEPKDGVVKLCIYKSTDGGAMDNKVTLHRDQPLRKVLDYFRYRCIWQGKRLDLYMTPNELEMGPVENIILTSIHVYEIITLNFCDWKGQTISLQIRMREAFRDAYADQAKALGVDPSKLIFKFRNTVLSIDATPLLAQLDHGDVVDVSLEGAEEDSTETSGEEKKDQSNSTETSGEEKKDQSKEEEVTIQVEAV
jgi:hypothetical protein